MNVKYSASVMVNTGKGIDTHMRSHIDNFVKQIAGVNSAQRSSFVPQVMVVDYNPAQISATALVNDIRRQGVKAQLIGF